MSDVFTHRIEIYTATLVIAGAYDLSIYRRVSDAINGEQRRFLPLRDATIAPFERIQQVQTVPNLLVDRGDALLVATVSEATPPADYPRDEQLRGVVPITAMLFTKAFVVRATMHKRPDLALPEALERITDEFVPLSNVQIFPMLGGFAPIARKFAALSLANIVALYQVDAPAAATPAPEPAATEAPVEETPEE
ncbi:MAG: hypothetical protein JST60_20125 [Chloroflexi bacterium SZAS-1]|jgi:hypothetical protein|nr:hypothetical protein [Chloroflexi bacterium SZAS-1]